MTMTEFLSAVLANTGTYCAVGIKQGKIRTRFTSDIPSLIMEVDGFHAAQADTYFAMFTFDPAVDPQRRLAANAYQVKAFWLDLDCGPTKEYTSRELAMAGLGQFCNDLSLPQPICINSGNGIHAYWVLPESINKDTWLPVAKRLKEVCAERNLLADPSCTTDAARILRVPETTNFKNPSNPLVVEYMGGDGKIDLFEFAAALGAPEPTQDEDELPFAIPDHLKGVGPDATSKALMGQNNTYRFEKIIALKLEGCGQLNHIVDHQQQIDEPLWRAGLSIANLCVDRDTAVHVMSDKHEGYDQGTTEKKASDTKGPYTCIVFDSLRPGVCKGCKHKGKFGSPILLGKEIAEAVGADNTVTTLDSGTKDVRVYNIPTYPFPFFRGKYGGIYRRGNQTKTEGEEGADKLVYENDFYVVKRMHDPVAGEVLWMRLHLPKDGVREFSVPLVSVLSKDRFRDAIAMQGMAVLGKTVDELMFYVSRWVKELQIMGQAEKVRSQFGWTDDKTFIIGDREITATGVKYSPPASAIMHTCSLLTKKGGLDEWKSVVNFYNNNGMEAQAFAFMLGFGSVLMPYTQVRGGIVNLMSPGSGTGKSTVQMAINSIWGHPFDLLLQNDDTYNAKIHRFGVLNNICATIDEITNMRDETVSQLSYAITQGRGKNRMESQTNAERINHTTWRLLAVTSSNSSLYDKLFAMKDFPEGEMMRIIELKIHRDEKFSKEFTDALFGKMLTNYGHAGEIFMKYVVDHLPEVLDILRDVQLRLDTAAGLGQRERFWSSIGALSITGGLIANQLGLIDIDVKRIFNWLVVLLKINKGDITAAPSDGASSIGAFIMANINNILIVRDNPADNGLPTAPLREPKGELLIRYEMDTKRLFLVQKKFKEWCAKNQVSYHDTVLGMRNAGVAVESVKKRMAKGTVMAAPPVNALLIDDTMSHVFDVEALLAHDDTGTEREAA